MKKTKILTAIVLAIILLLSSFTTSIAYNEIVSVTLNGELLNFDVPPQTINGRTMVPMRKIFESLGAQVYWNESNQTVTAIKDSTTIFITIGKNQLTKNGEIITLDVPAQMINDRTLVPVRAVSEAFNCKVDWNDSIKQVSISTTNTPVTNEHHIISQDRYTDEDSLTTFIEALTLMIECDTGALKCLTGYLNSMNSSSTQKRYQELFFDYIHSAKKSANVAYDMSIVYKDLNPTTNDIVKIINCYDKMLNGGYNVIQLGDIISDEIMPCSDNIYYYIEKLIP